MEMRAHPAPEKLNILISINRNIAAGLQDSIEFTKKQRDQQMKNSGDVQQSQPNSGNTYSALQQSQNSKTDFDI